MRSWLKVKVVLVLLSTQKTLLNYLQAREKPYSSAKILEGDGLFFSNQQKLQASDEPSHPSKHLWTEVHLPTPHQHFPLSLHLLQQPLESVNVRQFHISGPDSGVRIDYYKDRNNYYEENKLSVSWNPPSVTGCKSNCIRTKCFSYRKGQKDKACALSYLG